MPKGRLPGTSFQQGKKSFKRMILDYLIKTQEDINSIKREMNKEIERRFEERHGDLIHRVESALDGVIAMRTIFKEKGFITQKEYNKEKANMRKKK